MIPLKHASSELHSLTEPKEIFTVVGGWVAQLETCCEPGLNSFDNAMPVADCFEAHKLLESSLCDFTSWHFVLIFMNEWVLKIILGTWLCADRQLNADVSTSLSKSTSSFFVCLSSYKDLPHEVCMLVCSICPP